MNQRQRMLAGIIGSGLEWYDFALYGSFAGTIATLFFPTSNHFNGILATFGVFALGFLMRPLGGFIFGHFGDRIGRSRVLIFTVFGMTFPTMLIGLLPSYQHIGIIAPLLLLLARMIQGLMIGGEYTGALLFLAESEQPKKRGATACFIMMSALGGMLVGAFVAALLTSFVSSATIESWAWRVPFLFAGVLGIIGYHLRRYMTESPVFLDLIAKAGVIKKPAAIVFRHHWRFVLLAIGICVMTGIAQYLMFTYFPSFIQHSANLSLQTVLRINAYGMLVSLFAIPIFARWSDRVGRKPILVGSGLGFLFLSLPIFYLLSQSHIAYIIIGITLYGTLVGVASAPMAALYIELFPTAIRYSGIAISYNIAFAIFAGTAPVLAALSVKLLHTNLAPAFLIMIAAVISLIFFYLMPETAGREVHHH